MSDEPSPRPWRAEKNVVGWTSFIVDANGDGVAACWRTARGDDEKERQYDEANAALIVDAVNERERLLSAMKAIEDLCKVLDRTDLWEAREEWLDDAIYYIRKEARAAIKEDKE